MLNHNHYNFKLLLPTALITILLTACGGGGGGGSTTDSTGGFNTSNTNAKPQISSVDSTTTSSASSYIESSSASTQSSQSSKSSAPKSSTVSSSSSSKTSSSSARSSKAANNIDITPPSVPGSFATQTLLYDRAILTWAPSTDNVGVAFYKIYRDQVQLETINSSDNIYYDFDVAAGKAYTYSISAGDASGNWSALSNLEVKTPGSSSGQTSSLANIIGSSISSAASSKSSAGLDIVKPSSPDQVTKTSVYSVQVDIGWTTATDNVGVTAYKIYRDSVLIKTVTSDTFSYSDNTVLPDTSYWYGVSAGDAAGNWSSQKLLNVRTTASLSSGNATLKWLAPIQRENGTTLSSVEIGGYELRYKTILDSNYHYKSVENNITQLTLTGLLSGDYSFEISAFDTTGLYSNFVSIKSL